MSSSGTGDLTGRLLLATPSSRTRRFDGRSS